MTDKKTRPRKSTPRKPQTRQPDAAAQAITLDLPPVPRDPGASVSRLCHVDGHLRGRHGAVMQRLRIALDQADERLADGKHVHTLPDTLKWLLERIEAQLDPGSNPRK
jgi:hypothetical protein